MLFLVALDWGQYVFVFIIVWLLSDIGLQLQQHKNQLYCRQGYLRYSSSCPSPRYCHRDILVFQSRRFNITDSSTVFGIVFKDGWVGVSVAVVVNLNRETLDGDYKSDTTQPLWRKSSLLGQIRTIPMSSDMLTCHCNRHPNRLCAFVNLMECETPC